MEGRVSYTQQPLLKISTGQTTNLNFINPQKYTLTPCLRDATIVTGFRKNFLAHRIIINQKVWVESYLCLFPFFINSLAAFHRQRSQQVKWDEKKNKRVRYLNTNSTINNNDNLQNEISKQTTSCAPIDLIQDDYLKTSIKVNTAH